MYTDPSFANTRERPRSAIYCPVRKAKAYRVRCGLAAVDREI